MFTGIVEELGKVKSIFKRGNTLTLSIHCEKVLEDVNIGDSIAINGVCLTVTRFDRNSFQADVMPETFHGTSLSQLKEGAFVNLERAMAANGRFGGHFVTGHVDATGQIVRKEKKENAIYLDITFPKEFRHYVLLKGSIAVDGTSLTVFGLSDNRFTISLIPHTAKETVLGSKQISDIVNLEFDLIGKYLFSFWQRTKQEKTGAITEQFLKENGFLS